MKNPTLDLSAAVAAVVGERMAIVAGETTVRTATSLI